MKKEREEAIIMVIVMISLFIAILILGSLYSNCNYDRQGIQEVLDLERKQYRESYELKTIYRFNCPYNESIYFIADYYKSVVNQFNYNPEYKYLRKCSLEILGYGEEVN